jgi:hypothetical protein
MKKIFFYSKILQGVEYEILNDWFEMLVSNGLCHLDLISNYNRTIFIRKYFFHINSLSPSYTGDLS